MALYRSSSIGLIALLLAAFSVPELQSQAATDLAKQSQNPVGSLTSIPFQFDSFTGADLEGFTQYNLNIQPVVPIRITRHRNLIVRPIIPYFNIPVLPVPVERVTGLGDIQLQLYLAPAAGAVIWGIGPVLSFPTATNDLVRTGEWGAGPSFVVAVTTGHWVVGGLANQLWGYARHGDPRDLNKMVIQPFVNYNFGTGWTIATAPLITADWTTANDKWTVPLGAGFSKVTAFGQRPVSLSLQYYYNVARQVGQGNSQLRLQATLLFPTEAQHPAAN